MIIPHINPYSARASEKIRIKTEEANSDPLSSTACVKLSPTTPTVTPLANCATPQHKPALRCLNPLYSLYSALPIPLKMMIERTSPYIARTPAMATGIMPLIVIRAS